MGIALAPLGLLLAVNLFLNVGLPALINRHPERARITWGRAWMFSPGRVELWDLQVRVQNPLAQWLVTVDHATGFVDLPALLERRFVAEQVQAGEARFYFRLNRTEAPAIDTTPPIQGLLNPPEQPLEALYQGARPAPFDITLNEVTVAHLRELWMEDYRFQGDAAVRGSLDLLPRRSVALKALEIDLSGGDLRVADAPIADAVRGRVAFSLERLRVDQPLRQALDHVDLSAMLVADVEDLRFLSFYLRKTPWLALEGGEGRLEADLSVKRGRLVDGSWLNIAARDLRAQFLSYAMRGDGEIGIGVGPTATGSAALLNLNFSDYSIEKQDNRAPYVQGSGLRVIARTPDVALSHPFDRLEVNLDLPDSTIPDISVFNEFLPRDIGFSLRRGTGSANGWLRASSETGVALGALNLSARGLVATMDSLTLSGDAALHARLPEGRLLEGRYDISGSQLRLDRIAVLSHGDARYATDDSRAWWARLDLPSGRVQVGAPIFLEASFRMRCRDTVPFVTIFSRKEPLPRFARALLGVEDVSGEARVLLGDDTFAFPSFALRGRQAELRMRLRRQRESFRGSLYARYGKLGFGVELLGKKSKIHLIRPLDWYLEQRAP